MQKDVLTIKNIREIQSGRIRERIAEFSGGSCIWNSAASCLTTTTPAGVLPGFQPDSKLQMLLQLKDQAEIVIVISAEDIEKDKVRGDFGITYDLDVPAADRRRSRGLTVGSVCITKYTAAPKLDAFERRLHGWASAVPPL